MSVVLEPDGGFWRVTLTGSLSFAKFEGEFEDMFRDPRYRPGANTLWDFRSADVGSVEAPALRRIVGWAEQHLDQRRGARVAIVTSRDVDFGVARMYELTASRLPMQFRVFRALADAETWLRAAPAAD